MNRCCVDQETAVGVYAVMRFLTLPVKESMHCSKKASSTEDDFEPPAPSELDLSHCLVHDVHLATVKISNVDVVR